MKFKYILDRFHVVERRERLMLSRLDLAEKTGLTLQTIGNVERGHVQSPTLDTLSRLANALETDIDSLIMKVKEDE